MTELATKETLKQPHVDAAVVPAPEPALVTEEQVLLGSAAALAGPKVRRNLFAMMGVTWRSRQKADEPVKPRYYPRRHAFIEDALMARMMDRL